MIHLAVVTVGLLAFYMFRRFWVDHSIDNEESMEPINQPIEVKGAEVHAEQQGTNVVGPYIE